MSHRGLVVAEILLRWDQLVSNDFTKVEPGAAQLAQLLERRYCFCPDRAKREAEQFLLEFEERLQRAIYQ